VTNMFLVSTLVIVLGLATLVRAQSLPTPYNFFTDSLDRAQADVPALPTSGKEMGLWKFNGADGGRPQGTLIFDAVGNLYGTTEYAGVNGAGNVFELSPQANGKWTKMVLYSFCPDRSRCADGANPAGGVIIDSSGNLYGTTSGGGSGNRYGVVFELTPSADGEWTERVLYSFQGNEAWPPGGPVIDAAGNLYGTLLYGGTHNSECENDPCGAVFQLKPGGNGKWAYRVVHSFNNNGKDGFWPSASLTIDASGNLYGATVGGGISGGARFSS
jgi:uncharacterized repeat protein (TIGR03803 family)